MAERQVNASTNASAFENSLLAAELQAKATQPIAGSDERESAGDGSYSCRRATGTYALPVTRDREFAAAVMKHVKAGEEAVNGVENGGIFKFYSRGTAGSSLFELCDETAPSTYETGDNENVLDDVLDERHSEQM